MKKKVLIFLAGFAVGGISIKLTLDREIDSKPNAIHENPQPETRDQISYKPGNDELRKLQRKVAELTSLLEEYRSSEATRNIEQGVEKTKYIEFALQKYESLITLSPEQKELIGELEWESKLFWEDARAGKIDMANTDLPDLDGSISSILNTEQNEIYKKHVDAKKNSSTELASTAILSTIPVTLNLTDEQKDEIYKNLYISLHPDTQSQIQKRWDSSRDHEFDKYHQTIVWAAEEALTKDQLDKLKQAFRGK